MITKEQAVEAGEKRGTLHHPYNGKCQNWRANGKCQTWKTRPDEFRLPLKFGLYAYGAVTHNNAEQFHTAEECQHGGT